MVFSPVWWGSSLVLQRPTFLLLLLLLSLSPGVQFSSWSCNRGGPERSRSSRRLCHVSSRRRSFVENVAPRIAEGIDTNRSTPFQCVETLFVVWRCISEIMKWKHFCTTRLVCCYICVLFTVCTCTFSMLTYRIRHRRRAKSTWLLSLLSNLFCNQSPPFLIKCHSWPVLFTQLSNILGTYIQA